jgi:CRISPR/Cas system CSM-associated protein Csm3 (group 7 of RAMP superfamily)
MKLEVKLELKINTALMIAGGEMASRLGIDKATIKNKQGNLIISASSIKGKLRDECQRILLGLYPDTFTCIPPRAENMCPQSFIKGESNGVEYCHICKIFGSPWKTSPLFFSDLILTEFPKDIRNTTVKIGVAIDRYTHTVRDKSLYYLETSPQGYESLFSSKTSIRGEIESKSDAALLYLGIQSLFNIGGSKSVGLGWIEGDKISQFILTKADGTNIGLHEPSIKQEVKKWLEGLRLN